MEDNRYKQMSDDELVEEAQNNIKVSRIGAAQAELMRRNTEALRHSSKSSEKQNDIMLVFTFLLFFIGVMQLVITLQSWNVEWYISCPITLIILGFLFYYMKDLFSWLDDRHKDDSDL